MSRVLVCTGCGVSIEVFEAAQGARSDAEHQHLDPSTFVGGVCGCLESGSCSASAKTAEAVGRAGTGRETRSRFRGAA